MRYREISTRRPTSALVETPISQWTVDPEFDANADRVSQQPDQPEPHWSAADRRTLTEPARIARVKHAFSRTPFDINVVFYHLRDGDGTQLQGAGRISLADLRHRLGAAATDRIKPWLDPASINFILTNNVSGDNQISLSSGWMLAHRLGHALLHDPAFDSMHVTLRAALDALGRCYTPADPLHSPLFKYHLDHYAEALLFALGTMRSARRRMVDNSEFPVELLAQYIIKGSVRLNAPPATVTVEHTAYALRRPDAANRIVRDLQAGVNSICETTLQAAVGGIWVD